MHLKRDDCSKILRDEKKRRLYNLVKEVEVKVLKSFLKLHRRKNIKILKNEGLIVSLYEFSCNDVSFISHGKLLYSKERKYQINSSFVIIFAYYASDKHLPLSEGAFSLSLSKITTTAKKDKEKAFEAHPEYDASLPFPISYQGDPIRPLESERKKLKVAGNCNFIRALQRAQHTHIQ